MLGIASLAERSPAPIRLARPTLEESLAGTIGKVSLTRFFGHSYTRTELVAVAVGFRRDAASVGRSDAWMLLRRVSR